MERLWYTANSRFICHTKRKNRILLSFTEKLGTNKIVTNDGIEIKQEQYFDLLTDFFNDDTNKNLKSYIRNLKQNTWTSLAGSPKGKQLQANINKYYTELRKDHARDHKPYSHIKYDAQINRYKFIIYDKKKKFIVQYGLSDE